MMKKEWLLKALLLTMLTVLFVFSTVALVSQHFSIHLAQAEETQQLPSISHLTAEQLEHFNTYYEPNDDKTAWVIKREHYYEGDIIKGSTNEAKVYSVIYAGGINSNVEVNGICGNDNHSWETETGTTNVKYERNTDTHIRICTTCGRVESAAHRWPTAKVSFEHKNYFIYEFYYVKIDGKYYNKNNGQLSSSTSRALTVDDLEGAVSNTFSYADTQFSAHDGYGKYGIQSAVFLRENGEDIDGTDLDGDGNAANDTLADAYYHYQQCLDCKQLRKIAHNAENSGEFIEQSTGLFQNWFGGESDGYFCTGCFYGGAKKLNDEETEINNAASKYGQYSKNPSQCTDHLWKLKTYDGEIHIEECYYCLITRTGSHNWVSTTTDTQGNITYNCQLGCISHLEGDHFEVYLCNDHKLEEVAAVDASCTEDGYSAHIKCTNEGCEYTLNKEIYKALGHSLESVSAKAVTCTEDGYSAHKACSNCDYVEDKEIYKATGHDYDADNDGIDDGIVTTQPTCTTKGEKTYTCEKCGDTYTKPIGEKNHKYQSVVTAPTCFDDGYTTHTCSNCGDVYVDNKVTASHTYTVQVTPPTCAAGGYTTHTCSICGDTYKDNETNATENHTWDDGVITQNPTCTDVGVKTYTCSFCDETKTENIAATGHTEVDVSAVESTCTQTGLTAGKKCSVCGIFTVEPTEVAAKGHTYGSVTYEWDFESNQCTANGICSSCGDKVEVVATQENGQVTVTYPIVSTCTKQGSTVYFADFAEDWAGTNERIINTDLAAHTPGKAQQENIVLATCTSKGSYDEVVKCSKCNSELSRTTIETDMLAHTEVDDAAVAPTCTKTGLTAGKHCSVCNTVTLKQESVSATGHKYESIVTAPTCTNDGYTTYTCKVCKDTYTSDTIITSGHTIVTDPAVAATCTTAGKTEGSHCSVCNEILVAQTTIGAKGHTVVKDSAVAATCTQTGLTEGSHCSVCNRVLVEQTTIDAKGHTKGSVVVENNVAATCTSDGSYDNVVRCTVCNAEISKETISVAAKGHTYTIGKTEFTETWNATYTVCTVTYTCTTCGGNATLTASGSETSVSHITHETTQLNSCEGAGAITYTAIFKDGKGTVITTKSVDVATTAAGHNYDKNGDGTIDSKDVTVVLPTCTEGGYTIYTCRECGATRKDALTSAKGHDYDSNDDGVDDGVETLPASCTASGTRVYTCQNDGSHTKTETIPAKGHAVETDDAVSPTCTTTGLTEGKHCSVCNEILVAQQVVEKLDHTAGEPVVENNVDATCTEDGSYDNVTYCTDCNVELDRVTINVAATGHDWDDGEVTTKPTCTTAGVKTYICQNDKNHTYTAEVSANGHSYNTVVTKPSCTTQGYTTYTCSSCQDSYKADYVAALGHTEVVDKAVAATCTTTGLTEGKHCSVCNAVIIAQTVIPAKGHSYISQVTVPTCTEQGYTTFTCSDCGDNYVSNYVNEKGHTYTNACDSDCDDCGETRTPSAHVPAEDDGDCSTAINCTVCGAVTTAAKQHSFASSWTTEDGKHWHVCENTGCNIKENEADCADAKNDGDHNCDICNKENITEHTAGDVVVENNKAATCTVDGSYDNVTYCTECGEQLSKETVTVKASGHSYGEVTYVWAQDNLSVTATRTCANDNNHKETETVSASYAVITAAKCEEKGLGRYTSSAFANQAFAIQTKDVDIAATGHSYDDGVVTTPATCTTAGVKTYTCQNDNAHTYTEEVGSLGHDLKDVTGLAATCTQPGYTAYQACSRCDYIEGKETIDALGHKASIEWKAENDQHYHVCENGCGEKLDLANCSGGTATCEEKAECGICGNKYGSALGHNYAAEFTVDVEATCTTVGSKSKHCSRCDAKTEVTEIAATGHDWNDGEVTTKPTCTEKGVKTYTCQNNNAHTYTEEVGSLGHDLKDVSGLAATCTQPGYTAYQACSRCDYIEGKETIDALGHNEVSHEAKAPTCTEIGWDAYVTCSRCDYSTYEEKEALGHDYKAVVTAPTCESDGYTTHDCTRCDSVYTDTEVDALGHNYVGVVTQEPTCTEKGVMTYTCQNDNAHTYTEEITATGHTVVVDKAVAADCTNTGLTEGSHCSVCNQVLVEQNVVDALGHTEVVDKAVAATCTTTGLTEGKHCSVCNAVIIAQAETAALGHTEVIDQAKAPTCTESGLTEGLHCSVCGSVIIPQEQVDALGHNHKETIVTPATCTTAGEKKLTCACGDSYTETIKALGHNIQYHSAQDPTCGDIGWNDYQTCSRCDYSTYVEISATGEHTEGTPATCTQQAVCAVCEKSYGELLSHQYANWAFAEKDKHIGKCECGDTIIEDCFGGQATCDQLAQCEKCYNFYGAKLDHTPARAVVENNVDPNCTTAGSYDSVVYCTVCDAEISRNTVTVDALGHKYNAVVTAPTCTTAGYTTYTCSVCGDSYTDDEVIATGHSFTNYVFNEDATCTVDGTETAKCDRCDAKDTRTKEDSALDHDLEQVEAKAPTCTAIGWDAYEYCKRCDYSTYQEKAALDHTAGEAVVENNKAATCTVDGSYDNVIYCTRCNDQLSKETVIVKAPGHTLAAAVEENRVESTCKVAGSYDSVVYCSICKVEVSREKNSLALASHTAGEPVVENNVPATCTEDGSYDNVVYCTVCDAEISRNTVTVDALGHKYNAAVTNPTCTTAGYTTYTCSVCGDTYTDDEVAAKGHTASETVVENNVDPNCTSKGSYDKVVYCTVCEVEISRDIVVVNELGHDYKAVVTAPTCTEKGYTTHTCSRCKDSYKDSYVDALDHDMQQAEAAIAPTCTQVGKEAVMKCSRCDHITGGAEIDKLDHNLVQVEAQAPTCTEIGWDAYEYCKRCDYTTYQEKAALNHTAGETVVENNVPATCTEDGSYDNVIYCTVCDAEISRNTVTVDALGHDYEAVVTAPTCESDGYTTHDCTRCDSVYTDTVVDALGHNYVGVVTQEPTCTEKGVKTYTCQNNNAHTYTEEVDSLGHDLKDVSGLAATCTQPGYTAYQDCSRCDYIEGKNVINATGHSYGDWTQTNAPTCTEEGEERRDCKNCEAFEIQSVEATGHDWADATCTDPDTCTECGATQGEATGHSWDEGTVTKHSTCTETGVKTYTCAVCSATKTEEIEKIAHTEIEIPAVAAGCETTGLTAGKKCSVCGKITVEQQSVGALGHTEGQIVVENNLAPTCENAGSYDNVVYCSVCGEELSRETVTVNALGHTEVIDQAKAPTCTESGLTEGLHCSVCGSVIIPQEQVDSLGHRYSWEITISATCTTDGVKTFTCVCGDSYQEKVVALGHINLDGNCVCDRDGCEYAMHHLVDVEAKQSTCIEKGYSAHQACEICSYTQGKVETALAAHAYEATEEVVPTCFSTGSITYTCSVCEDAYTSILDMVDHTEDTPVRENVVPATCTKEGSYDSVVYCAVCKTELHSETKTLQIVAHTEGQIVVENNIDPTCENAGSYDSVIYCTVCNKQLHRITTIVDALGHDAVSHEAKAPTCTEIGWDAYETCKHCDYTTYAEKPALNHSYNAAVTNPTCTTAGYTTYTCSVCGDTYKDDEVAALGHTAGEVVVENNVDATCTEDGSYDNVVYCTVCDDEISRNTVTVDALGHDYEAVVTAPTCTTAGYTTYTCSVCGDSYTDDEVIATGHSFTNYISNEDATCTADGTETATCDNCEATDTRKDEGSAKGHTAGEVVVENNVDPNCTTAGSYDSVVYCTVCDAEISRDTITVDALGHTPVVDAAKAPTCTETGLTEGSHCSVCNSVLVAQQVAEKLDHTAGETIVENNVPATCTTAGSYDSVVYCTVCDAEISRDTITVDALGHSYDAVVTAPTCTIAGYTTYTCSVCGDTYTDDEVVATGHSFTNYISNEDATCTVDGTETAKCDRCDAKDTRTVEGSATGHSFGEWTQTQAPTCTADGEERRNCKNCGAFETQSVEATGHDWADATCTAPSTCVDCGATQGQALDHSFVDYVSDNNATCTADGTKTAKCVRCNATDTIKDVDSKLDHSFTDYVSNNDAICIVDGTETAKCDRCDAKDTRTAEGSATGHTPSEPVVENNVDATCTENGSYDNVIYCTVCDAEISRNTVTVDAPGHSYESVVTAPTCEERGYTTHTCSRCDDTYVDTYVDALGHTVVVDEAVSPDCENTGLTEGSHCSVCGKTLVEQQVVAAKGHTPGETVVENKVDATCTEEGSYDSVVYCTVCDAEISRDTITVDALGHSYDAVVTAPTCTTVGYTTYTCSVCGDTYKDDEVVATGHSFTNYVSNEDATCTVDGTETATCDNCEATSTRKDEGSATGHSFGEWIQTQAPTCTADGEERRNCKNCDAFETQSVVSTGHDWAAATCTAPSTCVDCGATQGEALDHSFVDYVSDNNATCTADGTKTAKCERCNATDTIKDVDSKLDHSFTNYVTNEDATCTVDGTETATCDNCEATSTRKDEGSATGHRFSEWTQTQAPTCTADGEERRDCKNCDAFETQSVVSTGHDWADATCTEPQTCSVCGATQGKALDHSFVDYVSDNNATCTADGTKTAKCERCNATDTIKDVDSKLDHSFTNYVSNEDATCTVDGTETAKCDRCDAKDTRTAEGSAKGHTAGETVVENNVDPTCTTAGSYDNVVYCTVCDAEISRDTITVDALGHSYDAVVTAPTCTTVGYTTYTCSVCGDTYKDDEVAALGHTAGEVVVENNVLPNCTEDGSYDNVVYCTVCDAEISRNTVTVDALGHKYNAVVTAPTCTTAGYTTYTCSVCKDTYTDNEVAATDHSFTNYVSNNDATCTVDGTETAKCDHCDAKDTRTAEGSATGHTPSEPVVENNVDPNCTTAGSYDNVVYCTVCDAEISRNTVTVDALGHSYDAVVTNPTCTAYGYTTHTCSVCDDTYVDTYVDALGHDVVAHEAKTPTCTEIGWDAYETCKHCDYTTYQEKASLGHEPGMAVEENYLAPSCTKEGSYEEVVYCTACGEELSRNTITLFAEGHTVVVDEAVAPTCTQTGLTEGSHCFVCDEVFVAQEEVSALGHDYKAVVTSPTCTNDGYTTYTCSVCDNAYTDDVITALGHTVVIDEAVAPDCENTGLTEGKHCSVCHQVLVRQEIVSALGHDYIAVVTAPTCTTAGYTTHTCSVCDDSYVTDIVAAHGHTADDVVVENYVAPTCTEDGSYDNVTYCAVCDEQLIREKQSISATGHNMGDWVETKAPTCNEEGSERRDCSLCDYFETRVKLALGHTPVLDEAIAPTCTSTGLTQGLHCSVCGQGIVLQQIVPAKGHVAGEAVVENKVEPTCTNMGSYDSVVYCTVCGEELSRHTLSISTAAHTAGETVVKNKVPATCTVAGSYDNVVYCAECGIEISRETKIIAPLGHTAADAIVENEVPPTCIVTGSYDSVVYCAVCDEELARNTVEIPLAKHTAGEMVVENNVDPTCIAEGSFDNVIYCSVCGAEISRETITVSRIAHMWGPVVVENHKDADCEHAGSYDRVVYCVICPDDHPPVELYRETVIVDALGHTAKEFVVENSVAPTCTTSGSYQKVVYCADCDKQISRETVTIEAYGHTEGRAVMENIVVPTCKTPGSYDSVVYCTECQLQIRRETVDVPALGHDEVIDVAVAPTCTSTGLTEGKHCAECDEIIIAQQTVAALEHQYKDGECVHCEGIDPNYSAPIPPIEDNGEIQVGILGQISEVIAELLTWIDNITDVANQGVDMTPMGGGILIAILVGLLILLLLSYVHEKK